MGLVVAADLVEGGQDILRGADLPGEGLDGRGCGARRPGLGRGCVRRLAARRRRGQHWAAFLREHEPYDHLVSLAVATQPEAYFRIQGIDIANLRGDTPPEPHGIRMPVFLNEPIVKTPREERAVLWQALLLGTSAARVPWQPLAARGPLFEHCRYLADYARGVAYWELRRDESVVLATPRNVGRLTAVRKDEVFVYLMGSAEQGTMRLGLPGGRYEATWFDPKNGTTVLTQEVEPKQGAVDIASPTFDEDIVLRVRRK